MKINIFYLSFLPSHLPLTMWEWHNDNSYSQASYTRMQKAPLWFPSLLATSFMKTRSWLLDETIILRAKSIYPYWIIATLRASILNFASPCFCGLILTHMKGRHGSPTREGYSHFNSSRKLFITIDLQRRNIWLTDTRQFEAN